MNNTRKSATCPVSYPSSICAVRVTWVMRMTIAEWAKPYWPGPADSPAELPRWQQTFPKCQLPYIPPWDTSRQVSRFFSLLGSLLSPYKVGSLIFTRWYLQRDTLFSSVESSWLDGYRSLGCGVGTKWVCYDPSDVLLGCQNALSLSPSR